MVYLQHLGLISQCRYSFYNIKSSLQSVRYIASVSLLYAIRTLKYFLRSPFMNFYRPTSFWHQRRFCSFVRQNNNNRAQDDAKTFLWSCKWMKRTTNNRQLKSADVSFWNLAVINVSFTFWAQVDFGLEVIHSNIILLTIFWLWKTPYATGNWSVVWGIKVVSEICNLLFYDLWMFSKTNAN